MPPPPLPPPLPLPTLLPLLPPLPALLPLLPLLPLMLLLHLLTLLLLLPPPFNSPTWPKFMQNATNLGSLKSRIDELVPLAALQRWSGDTLDSARHTRPNETNQEAASSAWPRRSWR